MKFFRLALITLLIAFGLLACSDDTVDAKNGERPTCEIDERYNPITGEWECVETNRNNQNTTNNRNNTTTNNTTTNNTNTLNNVDRDMGTDSNLDDGDDSDMSVERDMPPASCGPGEILGIACTPTGDILSAADVTISGTDCDGNPFTETVVTNVDGTFEFNDVPSGNVELEISTGSFNNSRTILVRDGKVTDLTTGAEKVCLDGQDIEIAVVGGKYDHVEAILLGLNLPFDIVGDDETRLSEARSFLQNSSAMSAYDIIFINCGELWTRLAPLFPIGADPRIQMSANLRTFVQGGGSLYVSDRSHPFIELAFPELIDFYRDDSKVTEAWKGYAPQSVIADVVTSDIQGILSSTTAEIEFPHDLSSPNPDDRIVGNNWAVMEGVGMQTVTHLTSTVSLCASPAGTNPCPGESGSVEDAPLMVTWKSPAGGTVTFTSFHNERQQDAVSQDMQRILRFLIFQL